MPLRDFAEFLEPLTPVYRGKAYPLPPVGVKDAVPLMHTLEQESDFAVSEEEFERILLGDQLEQMRADNVPAAFVRHALTCALVDFTHGREAAEARYAQGLEVPKAAAGPAVPEDSQPSTSTGEANATPSPDSGTGTKTSRPSSAPKQTGRATRSSGTRSSSSGRSSKPASTPSSESTS